VHTAKGEMSTNLIHPRSKCFSREYAAREEMSVIFLQRLWFKWSSKVQAAKGDMLCIASHACRFRRRSPVNELRVDMSLRVRHLVKLKDMSCLHPDKWVVSSNESRSANSKCLRSAQKASGDRSVIPRFFF
jgi:hypothetical protein